MYRLKISDLSFCELATEESEVKGGLNLGLSNIKELNLSSLLTKLLSTTSKLSLEEYSPKEVYSDSESSVSTLENKATEEYRYIVSSKDGKSQTAVVVNPKFTTSTAVSLITSYSS
ncbi:MAG: hypothetical protein KME29_18575 [Calothrix sp. FI2-JRJ7]|jgi:hypothetical protein|nr:hypothetical protein [Calothrix sp. FI2-JRJ7]